MSEAQVGTAPPAATTTGPRRLRDAVTGRPLVVAALALAVVAAVVVAVAASSGDDGTAPAPTVTIEGAERFFATTLQDWVSFADAVVVAEVTRERRIPPTPAEVGRGEGYVGRVVTMAVADVVWQRAGAEAAPAALDVVTVGWALQDGREVPARLRDAEHLVPGGRYLVPVLRLEGEGWLPMSPTAILRVDGAGRAVLSGPRDERSEAVAAVEGRTLDEVADVLASTAPHPEVGSVSPSAGPVERMEAVYGAFG